MNETLKALEKMSKTKNWVLENIKTMTNLQIDQEKKKTHMNKNRSERGDIIIDITEVQRIVRLL